MTADEQRRVSELVSQAEAALAELRGLLSLPASGAETAPPAPATGGDAFAFVDAIQHDGIRFTDWPATARITTLGFGPGGVQIEFTRKNGADRWPDVRPADWDGDLQYCLGMALRIDGQWHVSAPIQFWHDLDRSGGNIGDATVVGKNGKLGQVSANWFYEDHRWGPMCRQPQPGEQVGFFVVAGSVRGGSEAISVRERSNVVVVPFPTASGDSHSF
jgi:hypothetical protein